MISAIQSVQGLQVWVLGGSISILLLVLGFIISLVANYLGKKIDKTVEVSEKVVIEMTEIAMQIKSLFHSINSYELGQYNLEKRVRDIEIEHAKHSGICGNK